MATLKDSPERPYKEFIIKTHTHMDNWNWAYTIYKVTGEKWKRVRGMQGYKSETEAYNKSTAYIDEFGQRHLK